MFRVGLLFNSILCFVLCGCTHIEKSNVTVRQWHYEDGTLMKEQEYIDDSIEHGTYRYFYPSGALQDSAQITHNKFNGKRFEYHENGQLYILTTYINNKERSGVNFRENGILNEYKAFTYTTDLVFIIRYDSLGKMKSYEGNPIHSWVQEDRYPIGKEFSVELLVASPPNCRTEVEISDWDASKQQASNKKKYTPDQFNRVGYSRKQNPENNLYILHVANIRDTVIQTSINDTLVIIVGKEGKSSYSRKLSDVPSM